MHLELMVLIIRTMASWANVQMEYDLRNIKRLDAWVIEAQYRLAWAEGVTVHQSGRTQYLRITTK